MKTIIIPDNINGLIFDLDGTLADTMPIHYKAWMNSSLKFNFSFTYELFVELSGIPTKTIVNMINIKDGLNLDPETVEKFKENSYLQNLQSVKTIKPVMDILLQYHDKIPVSIGTGSRRHIAEKTLTASSLKKYFSIVITADDVVRHKPYPDTFLKCSEEMGIQPNQCMVFEDGLPGLKAANDAGMTAIDIRDYL